MVMGWDGLGLGEGGRERGGVVLDRTQGRRHSTAESVTLADSLSPRPPTKFVLGRLGSDGDDRASQALASVCAVWSRLPPWRRLRFPFPVPSVFFVACGYSIQVRTTLLLPLLLTNCIGTMASESRLLCHMDSVDQRRCRR